MDGTMLSLETYNVHLRKFASFVLFPFILGVNNAFLLSDRCSWYPPVSSSYLNHRHKWISRYALATTILDPTGVDPTDQNKPKYGSQMVKPTEISYNTVVQSAYLRHILLETSEMSEYIYKMLYNSTAMEEYLLASQGSNNVPVTEGGSYRVVSDPFGNLASHISICEQSKLEGGLIGWVDNPFYLASPDETPRNHYVIDHPLLPKEAIQTLFLSQPKGGDVIKVQSTRGVHLLLVEDVLVTFRPGGQNEIIKTRSKVRPCPYSPPLFSSIPCK